MTASRTSKLELIDHQLSFKLNQQIHSLKKNFDLTEAQDILKQLYGLAMEASNRHKDETIHIDWDALEYAVNELLVCINDYINRYSSKKYHESFEQIVKDVNEELREDQATAQSPYDLPKIEDSKYVELTKKKLAELEREIPEANRNIADHLFNSEEFKGLSKLWKLTIQPQANQYRFRNAYQELMSIVDDKENLYNDVPKAYKDAGRNILRAVHQSKTDGRLKNSDLPLVTEALKGSAALIKDANDMQPDLLTKHMENTKKVLGVDRHWGKIIGGSLAVLAGVALIALSVTAVVMTFGASTPFSIFGLTYGMSLIVAATTLNLAVFAGASLAVTGSMFANQGAKGEIARATEDLTNVRQEQPKNSR